MSDILNVWQRTIKITKRMPTTIWKKDLNRYFTKSYRRMSIEHMRRCWVPLDHCCSVTKLCLPLCDPWTVVCQASLSFTISQSFLRLMSTESVMPSNHLFLSPPSPLALSLSQHHGLFQWTGSSHQVAKVLELQLQHQSFQWIIRVDFL